MFVSKETTELLCILRNVTSIYFRSQRIRPCLYPRVECCDDTPSAPSTYQLLQTISLLGRWSSSGSDRGIAHFFIATRNTIERVGEKEQTNETNNTSFGVNSKCKTRSYVTLCIPVSIYRLTLARISNEDSTTHEEC